MSGKETKRHPLPTNCVHKVTTMPIHSLARHMFYSAQRRHHISLQGDHPQNATCYITCVQSGCSRRRRERVLLTVPIYGHVIDHQRWPSADNVFRHAAKQMLWYLDVRNAQHSVQRAVRRLIEGIDVLCQQYSVSVCSCVCLPKVASRSIRGQQNANDSIYQCARVTFVLLWHCALCDRRTIHSIHIHFYILAYMRSSFKTTFPRYLRQFAYASAFNIPPNMRNREASEKDVTRLSLLQRRLLHMLRVATTKR